VPIDISLKGALLVRARKITDGMAIRCAHSIAGFSGKRGINPDNIVATMEETDVFAREAADVAMQAAKDNVARVQLSWDEVYQKAGADINASRNLVEDMKKLGYITEPPAEFLETALKKAIDLVNK
jgi:malate dehydrogenase (oxaloacetate-decarboxylating)